MGKLLDAVASITAKSKVKGVNKKAEYDVLYSTGFLALDFLNGTKIHVESKDRNFVYNATGIVDGSTNTFVGRSKSGKSTLVTQSVGEMLRWAINKKLNTALYYDDVEGSLPQFRKEFLMGLTQEQLEEYVNFRNAGITTENVFEIIKAIHASKTANRKDYEYDTGLYDTYGERIFKLAPTFYIVDSLAMLLPEDVAESDGLGSNMEGGRIAKMNTMMFKKMSQLCKEANIMFFTINHILDKIQTGFLPTPSQISGLKQDERLPGGKSALYLANNMFRCDDGVTLKPDKDYGIDGSIVKVTIMKSRTNIDKRYIELVFNKTEGYFDKELSLHYLLKQNGRIQGSGAYSYLEDCPDIKFSAKTFKKVLEENEPLQEAFAKECYKVLYPLLSETRNVHSEDMTVSDKIAGMFNKFSMGELELSPT